jgi:hypothetical protein
MFDPPATALGAGVHAVVIGAAFLFFGYLVVSACLGRRLDRAALLALSLPGVMLVSLVAMLAHILTAGWLFATPTAARVLILLIAAVAVATKLLRHVRPAPLSRPELLVLVGATGLAAVAWFIPLLEMYPLHFGRDTRLHMGWVMQLIAGDRLPTAGLTGEIPNYYPWLFHSLTATVVSLTPGGRSFHAQGALQVMQVGGIVFAFFALGREITRRLSGGAAAVIFGSLSGGFGYFAARAPDVIVYTRAETLKYMGDFLPRRSYNMSFHNLVPVFPREVCFVLLVAVLVLLLLGRRRADFLLLAAGGTVLGLIGLTGGESFIVGTVVAGLWLALPPMAGLTKRAAAVFVPAFGLWALWLVPLAINYVRLGGFFGDASAPVHFPPLAFLVAYGIVTPFALYGAFRVLRRLRSDEGVALSVVTLAGAGALVLLAGAIPELLGRGFATLGREHRYWPLVYLGIVLLGAFGAADLLDRAIRKAILLAVAFGSAIVMLAIPTPILASLAVPDLLRPPPAFEDAVRNHPAAVFNALAPEPGHRCVAAAPERFTPQVFAYTGYRMVALLFAPEGRRNRARIQWRDIYEDIPGDDERILDNEILTQARVEPEEWEAIADKYGVDLVLTRWERADAEPFAPYEKRIARAGDRGMVVIVRRDCGGVFEASTHRV